MSMLPVLHGRRILITRPGEPGEQLAELLRAVGADVYLRPALDVVPKPESLEARAAREAMFRCDRLFVTSHYALAGLLGASPDGLPKLPLYAVGARTASLAREYAFPVIASMDRGGAAALVALIQERGDAAGRNYVWPRGDLSPIETADALKAAGARVEAFVVYVTLNAYRGHVEWPELPVLDAVIFASPSAVRHLDGALPPEIAETYRNGWMVIAIGDSTAAAAGHAGWRRVRVAKETSNAALVAEIAAGFAAP